MLYQVNGTLTIPVVAIVEAENEKQAKEIAMTRGVDKICSAGNANAKIEWASAVWEEA